MYGLFVHIYARNGRLFVKLRVVAGREDCYVMQIWPFAWNFFYLFGILHKRWRMLLYFLKSIEEDLNRCRFLDSSRHRCPAFFLVLPLKEGLEGLAGCRWPNDRKIMTRCVRGHYRRAAQQVTISFMIPSLSPFRSSPVYTRLLSLNASSVSSLPPTPSSFPFDLFLSFPFSSSFSFSSLSSILGSHAWAENVSPEEDVSLS